MSYPDERCPDAEWPAVAVEDLVKKGAMGPFGSSIRISTFVPQGVPIKSGQHLHGIRVDDSPGFNFITHKHAHRLRNANVRSGDVVIIHAGNIGRGSIRFRIFAFRPIRYFSAAVLPALRPLSGHSRVRCNALHLFGIDRLIFRVPCVALIPVNFA